LSIQPGLRILYNSRFSAPLIYSLNLKYNISENFFLRASYAKGFRAPSLKELYFNFTQLDHNIHGNPNLKPEVSNNFNIALNYKNNNGKDFYNIGLTAFYNQIKDKIDYQVYPNDQLRADYINLPIALYKNFGTNLDFTYQIQNIFNFGFSIGFTAVSKLSDTTSFFYSPNFAGNVSYKEKFSKLRLSLNYKYYGKFIEYTAQKEVGTDKYDITSQSIAGDYHNLDAQISRSIFDNKIELAIGAKNLFNNTKVNLTNSAQTNNGLIGYGRTFYIKMNVNFEKL
jgi:outer membrane receptor for ferrienterochelin and colicins